MKQKTFTPICANHFQSLAVRSFMSVLCKWTVIWSLSGSHVDQERSLTCTTWTAITQPALRYVLVLTLLGDQEMSVKKIQRGVKHRVEFFTRISWLPSEVCPFLHFWKCEENCREGSIYSHQRSNIAQNEEKQFSMKSLKTVKISMTEWNFIIAFHLNGHWASLRMIFDGRTLLRPHTEPL